MQIIRSKNHHLIKHWNKLRSCSSYRQSQMRALIYGKKLITELLTPNSSLFPNAQFITSSQSLLEDFFPENKSFLVDKHLFKNITGITGKGVEPYLAEVDLPPPTSLNLNQNKVTLVLDRLQDPGNIGTLIRSACAFNISHIVFLTPGCDPFNDKALRAAKGATFQIPLSVMSSELFAQHLHSFKGSFLCAHTSGIELHELVKTHPMTNPSCLLIGNESEGPNPLFLKQAQTISIKTNDKIESLNAAVAGSIFCCLIDQHFKGDFS
jgi:RNA methyltransferase, TrmH family